MYRLAEQAFGPVPDFDTFGRLYSWMITYWGIGRNGAIAPANAVFDLLVDNCAATSRHSGRTLLNYDRRAVSNSIRAMKEVKLLGEYPHMAASKFLHFYNPALYPIYDNAVIWNIVLLGAFSREWKLVCRDYGIKVCERSEQFLITYCSWAAEVMQAAGPAVMIEFQN